MHSKILHTFLLSVLFCICMSLSEPTPGSPQFIMPPSVTWTRMTGETRDNPTLPWNVGFVGRGYDILKGNTRSQTFDEGFRESVYKMELSEDWKSDDWRFLQPKGVHLSSQVTCKTSFTSRMVKSEASMQASIAEDISFSTERSESSSESSKTSVDASVSGSGWGVDVSASYSYNGEQAQSEKYGSKFSENKSYQSMRSSMSSRESVFTISEASCSVYEVTLNRFNRPEFTDEFLSAVKMLPVTYQGNDALFRNFIDAFGTHVTTKVLFGSKMGVWSQLSRSAVSSMEKQGLSVEKAASTSAEKEKSKSSSHEASLEASGWGYEGKVSAGHSESSSSASSSSSSQNSASKKDSEAAAAFEGAEEDRFMYTIGARPGDSPEQWAKESQLDPLPIKYELQEISEIVSKLDKQKGAALSFALRATCPNNCAPPTQETGDFYIETAEAAHSGVRSTLASCTAGGELLGGGFAYSTTPGKILSSNNFKLDHKSQLNYAFPHSSGGFAVTGGMTRLSERRDEEFLPPQAHGLCYSDTEMDLLTVKKLGADESVEVQHKTGKASKIVSCPDGYSLLSGGYVLSDNFEQHYTEIIDNGPIGSAWKCGIQWTGSRELLPALMCFARCARFVSQPVQCHIIRATKFTVKPDSGPFSIVSSKAICPPEMMAVGGGWLSQKPAEIENVVASFPFRATFDDRRGYMGPQSYTTEFVVDKQYATKYQMRTAAICCHIELKNMESFLTQRHSLKTRKAITMGRHFASPYVVVFEKQEFQGISKVVEYTTTSSPLETIGSVYVPPGRDVELCTGANYGGCIRYKAPVEDLENMAVKSIRVLDESSHVINPPPVIPPPPPKPIIEFFEHCNYGGRRWEFSADEPDLTKFAGNDEFSSIKISPGYMVIVYEHSNYQGAHMGLYGSNDCFEDEGWNDQTSSFRIHKL